MDKTRVVVVAFNRLEKLILSGIATHLYPIPTTINHTPAALANNKNHNRLWFLLFARAAIIHCDH